MLHTQRTFISFTALILEAFLWAPYVSAHFVWLETPSALGPNQPAIVKAYFGEYHESLKETTGGRLDERAGLASWLVEPNGTRRSLDVIQKNRFFQIPVKPSSHGTYQLIAMDQDEPVRDGTPYPSIGMLYKPMFYARAQFSIFTTNPASDHENPITSMLPLDIIPTPSHHQPSKGPFAPMVNEEMRLQVFFKGRPLAKAKPTAYAPNGWSKELETNDSGVTQFTPLWPGLYVIDFVNLEKIPGEFQKQPYEAIRHRSTLSIHVPEVR
ncbi:MAG TPA: DUF4198 domain-containing protein [Nitrospirales bacterium]|nr:hypothetical protein [Nitrospiraceae bacterium]HNP28898.1 DUF4198 domain-containing protein [Nitrospirales bacterium]